MKKPWSGASERGTVLHNFGDTQPEGGQIRGSGTESQTRSCHPRKAVWAGRSDSAPLLALSRRQHMRQQIRRAELRINGRWRYGTAGIKSPWTLHKLANLGDLYSRGHKYDEAGSALCPGATYQGESPRRATTE